MKWSYENSTGGVASFGLKRQVSRSLTGQKPITSPWLTDQARGLQEEAHATALSNNHNK